MMHASNSLLRQIQEDAVSGDCELAAVLRRCKLLAARLDSRVLQDWIRWESDGYPDDVTLPDYRVVRCRVLGHFSGPFGSGLQNAEIPIGNIPKKFRKRCTVHDVSESIHAIEELLVSSKDGVFQVPILPDLVRLFGDRVYVRMHCIAAWKVIPSTNLVEIVNAVRNKVLDFALEIEKLDPKAGDVEAGKPTIPQGVVNQVFETTVYGGIANVAGSVNELVATNVVVAGNLDSLQEALKGADVPGELIDELAEALTVEPRPQSNGKFGSKVSAWLGKMVSKAAEGTWSVTTDVAADMLTAFLRAYYGLGGE